MVGKQLMLCASLILGLFLGGCASVDQGDYLEAYEETYRAKVNYRTHSVPRDGYRIHVREYGKRGELPALVLMHGFPDSMHLYDRLVPLLLGHRQVITFDFLGWGDSDKPEGHRYDVESLRRDLEAVITYFDLRRIVPVVHDASGQPGIDWSVENPEKTAGLVLLNTYYGPSPALRAPEAIERFSTPGIKRDISVWMTRHFDALWIQGYNRQIAEFISREELREPYQKLLGHQSLQIRPAFYGLNRVLNEEVEKRGNRMGELQGVKAPVRIIFGKEDADLNARVAVHLHELFPNSELYLIENAGHFVQVDEPGTVAELIRCFPRDEKSCMAEGG